ncbi:hypothetical protein D3C75_1365600 [compost metagenome]
MQALLLPAFGLGQVQHVLHKAARATHIQMDVVLRRSQHLGCVQCSLGLLIEMQEHPVGKRRVLQAFDKSRALP